MGNSLMDTYVQVFANRSVWMESAAIEQLHTTARNLQGIRAAVGLPDLHPGRGYPVGAAFFSTEHFYPALVGGDIGCGMALHATSLRVHKTSPSKLEKALGVIDGPLPEALQEEVDMAQLQTLAQRSGVATTEALLQSLGTIGGGNHFAELQAVDTLYEEGALDKKCVHLMVHSGSRGLGGAILREHVERFNHDGLAAATPEAQAYWQQHEAAIAYARLNRSMIARRMGRALRVELTSVLDISHNHVQRHEWRGASGFLHRKGATPADEGLVVIPGSRGDYSYLVRPAADRDESLHSLAHGAGRKWARSDCVGRLRPKFSLADLQQTRFDSAVVCADRELIYEEAPQAYKDVDGVIASLQEAGLLTLVARLKPLLTYKKGVMQCC
ncbi:MAG: RNA ligase RtcB family protein [Comamonas sp.]|nr:RNA ligase RtcB family protein [Comamonas sp.]